MTTCGSLRSLFENPLPENPTLIESLSPWNQLKHIKQQESASYAEIFGELYFQEKPHVERSSLPPQLDHTPKPTIPDRDPKRENMTLDSLLGLSKDRYKSSTMCTEGLGSESSDDVDDLMENGGEWRSWGRGRVLMGRRRTLMPNGIHDYTRSGWETRQEKSSKVFPPPLSSIGKSGKPRVCLRSYREDGRFVLREMRIPCQEYLRASREDGRLKLHFVRPNESIEEGDEEKEENGEEQEVGGIQENKENIVSS